MGVSSISGFSDPATYGIWPPDGLRPGVDLDGVNIEFWVRSSAIVHLGHEDINSETVQSSRRGKVVIRRVGAVSVLIATIVLASGAAGLADFGWRGARPAAVDTLAVATDSRDLIVPRDLEIHPDHIYRQFLSTRSAFSDLRTLEIVRRFQDLLSLFSLRQSTDDNFTMRVIDGGTGGLLELRTLDSLRALPSAEAPDWPEIDRIRRRVTSRIVDSYEAAGMAREQVTVKWGRRNQVLEARDRDTPFIEHEINLARMLHMSLLATEIGTVETFNDDRVVSRVGARSRYQMMPSTLRDLGVEHYTLRTATGRRVQVREEWHPLIALESAFIVARAYSNAMGHEIPGLSAYHTGPYNVFRIYREYLNAESSLFTGNSNVVGAYQWGLTDGFESVSAHTSFGTQSRGYLPSLYGAMKATEEIPIDTSRTWLVERVVLKPGTSILLSDLLDSLDTHAPYMDWRTPAEDSTTYLRFRRINPHINLPDSEGSVGVPVVGNVRLVASDRSAPVRFFVPRGSSSVLAAAGFDPFDHGRSVTYGHESFNVPAADLKIVDHEYRELVNDIREFGFTDANRTLLDSLTVRMREEFERESTYYRWISSEVARLHRWVWGSRNFDDLAAAVESARSRVTIPAMAPAPLPERIGAQPLRTIDVAKPAPRR